VTTRVLSEVYTALMGATSTEQLREEMEKFTKQMGFDAFAYVMTVTAPSLRAQQYIIHGYPKEWAARYISRDYFKVDPLVLKAGGSVLPAIWDATTFEDADSSAFWEEARSFGVGAGMSIVLHEQPGVQGIFSLSRDRVIDHTGHDLAALIGRTQMFASLVHHAVCRIDLPTLLPEASTMLTARERECLKWSADGKTAWEIGQILGISERTAVFHINNIVQKLGAANKTQAIVRAVALRLI
jgi:LuxR family quorum-sensing system transcriptional regulator SolR